MKQIKVTILNSNLPTNGVKAREKYIHGKLVEAGIPVFPATADTVFPSVRTGQLVIRHDGVGCHSFTWLDTNTDRMFSGADIHEAFQQWEEKAAQSEQREPDTERATAQGDCLLLILNEQAKRA